MEGSAFVYIILTVTVCAFAMCVNTAPYADIHVFTNGAARRGNRLSREQARNSVAEFAVFALLFAVSACRIAVGNDYWPYRFNFRLIAQERHVSSEIGFNLIVQGMQKLFGYDNYLPIFGLFSFITTFLFVLALHYLSRDYLMSLFLLMTGGYYFNSLNSVRYYMALAFAMYAFKYVLRGANAPTWIKGADECVKFVLWIFVAAMFHKSVLFVIPLYILAGILSTKRFPAAVYAVLAVAAAVLLIFGKTLIREIVFKFYPYYRNSWQDSGRISYVNVLRTLMVFVLLAVYVLASYHKKDQGIIKALTALKLSTRVYIWLNVFALATLFAGSFVPEATRLAYYMMAFQIFLIPEVLMYIKAVDKRICLGCTVLVVSAYVVYFVFMLKGMYAVDVRLLPYLNWIFN